MQSQRNRIRYGMSIASINPTNEETLKEFHALDSQQIEEKLAKSVHAFEQHRRTSFAQRRTLMITVAALLERENEQLARIMTLEMGKLLRAATEEITKCAKGCRFYAENAERFLADQVIQTDAARSFIRYEPIGAVLAVMPWNFPFWQVFRFAAPALMAGNVALLKHASNVPQSALAIEKVLRDAGFDHDEFQTLLITSDQVARVLEDERVRATTLTGSEPAGASVASIAAKRIKKSVLELGGSDPFIVMPSANLDDAVKSGIKARIVNNGQSCIAAKRFIVHEKIADEYEKRFVDAMK